MCIVITLFIVGYVKDKAQILKEEEAKKAGESGEKSKLDGLSEEDKKRLLEEYLKSTAGAQNPPSEIPPATADGEEQPQANAEESDSEKE